MSIDATEARLSGYLGDIRDRIKRKWSYPCVMNETSWDCEYKAVALVVEFGVAKDGEVRFIKVVKSSGHATYDEYAVKAVKDSAPFPPIPDSFSSTGLPLRATFKYMIK